MANYKSATGHDVRDKVEEAIREEMQRGNYIVTTAKPTIVSALGAIPKPDSDKIRLIHDCSRPQHSNVNLYSDTKRVSVKRGPDGCGWRMRMADGKMRMEKCG